MGQQQLILTILVTIIVGIATTIAINTFQNSRERSNVDAVRQQVLTSHNHALAHYERPRALGGGGGTFTGITAATISLPDSTADGNFELIFDDSDNQSYQIVVNPRSGLPDITFTLTPDNVTSDLDP